MPVKNDVAVHKSNLVNLSVAEAKKAGENYASFVVGLRGEFAKNKISESMATNLLKQAAALGDCGGGVMCVIFT